MLYNQVNSTPARATDKQLAEVWKVQPRRVRDLLKEAGISRAADKTYDYAAAMAFRTQQVSLDPSRTMMQGVSNQWMSQAPKLQSHPAPVAEPMISKRYVADRLKAMLANVEALIDQADENIFELFFAVKADDLGLPDRIKLSDAVLTVIDAEIESMTGIKKATRDEYEEWKREDDIIQAMKAAEKAESINGVVKKYSYNEWMDKVEREYMQNTADQALLYR